MVFVQGVDLKFLFHDPLATLSEVASYPNWVRSVSFGRVSRRLQSSAPFRLK
jgi:hypothetical protein